MTLRSIATLVLIAALGSLPSALSAAAIATPAAPAPVTCAGGSARDVATPPALATSAGHASPEASARDDEILHQVTDVPVPGSPARFDYQSLDPASSRLYIAHMGADQVIAVSTATLAILGVVEDVPMATGVLAVPDVGRVYAAAPGDHDVAVIDPRTLAVVTRLGDIGFPDGLAYAPRSRQVFVSDEAGGGELVIDATSNEVVTTIAIGGEAGNTQVDPGSGCIVVAVQDRDQLAFIDPATDRLVARHDLDAGCASPHGFLIDAPRRLAFVTCEDNAKLVVVDLQTLTVTATSDVGDGPDVLAFDPGWRRLYVASEAGVVSVFDERGAALTAVGTYRAPHAHSVAVDPRTHRVYLPLENVDGRPVLRVLEPRPPATP
jgi:DNA-binding beta-propeller fold protein YncE